MPVARSETQQAWGRARRLYVSKGFQGVYVDGFLARRSGKSETTCPYPRKHGAGWANSYRRAWQRGWQSG